MPTYADFGGWVISTIAGWFVVTADTRKGLLEARTISLQKSTPKVIQSTIYLQSMRFTSGPVR